MLKQIYLWMVVLIVLSTFNMAMAGNEQSIIDSLIQKALEKNPGIIAAEHDYQGARLKAKAEGWFPDPTVSIAASNLPLTSLSFDKTPMSGVAISYVQKFPWPGKLVNQKGIANLETKNAYLVKSAWENAVVQMVKGAYFDYSYWKLAEKIVIKNIELLKALVEVAQTRYANGKGLEQDVLSAQTSLWKTKDRKLNVVKMKKTALANLNRLIDEPPFELVEIPANLPEADNGFMMVDSLIETAFAYNPSLKSSETKIEIASKKRSLTKASYWPDFTLAFEYRIREDVPMDIVSGEDFISARLGLSLPLWFLVKQNNLAKAAKKNLYSAESRKRSYERMIEYEVTEVFLDIERKKESIKIYDEAIIPQAEAALESSNIAYQVGKVDFLNLLTAQLQLFELQIERLGLLRDYNHKLAALEELVGKNYER